MTTLLQNFKKFVLYTVGIALMCVVGVHADIARAAIVSTVQTPETTGGTFVIEVHVKADTNAINEAEGTIVVPAGVSSIQISEAGSAFPLWTQAPTYSFSSHSISFAGGVPGGIAVGQDVLLFTIYGNTQAPGTYVFEPIGISVYQNDGSGTKDTVTSEPVSVIVTSIDAKPKDVLAAKRSQDTVAPELHVALGHDASLFDNRYFLSFYGSDVGTGIDHFDVSEGFGAFKKADNYYVLSDQKLGSLIRVRAVDGAGNSKVVYVLPTHPFAHPFFYVETLALLAILYAVIWYVRRFFLRKRT